MTPETLTWVEQQKPGLVARAEGYVKATKLHCATPKTQNKDKGKRTPEVKTNQLRNLLNAAQAGDPLALLINFLRYQVGRRSQGWKHETSAKALLKEFEDNLMPLCDGCLARDTEGRFELEAHLAAQFLGFVIREYTYRCAEEGTRP